jgi:hypothetical protein
MTAEEEKTMATEKIEVPAAPAGLPAAVEKRWKETYVAAYKEAQTDEPEQSSAWPQYALRAANKTLRVPEPENYKDAMRLEPWQFIHRDEKDEKGKRVLKLVTRDGKKFTFEVPESAKKADEGKSGDGK